MPYNEQTVQNRRRTEARLLLSGAFLLLASIGTFILNAHATSVHSFPLSSDSPVIAKSLNFFKSCQHEDGGFGDGGITEWVMIAISASGQDPNTWEKNGNSALDYLRKHVHPSTIWDYTRIVLALSLCGEDPRSFSEVNYLKRLKQFYCNGQIGDPLSLRDDFWGVLALTAAGESNCPEVVNSRAFIKQHQGENGSWAATTTRIEVCPDNTAVALMALLAAGEDPESPAIKKGLAYLDSIQNPDGGFPYLFVPSNAATDAWVIQALVAAGVNPLTWRAAEGNPVAHLMSLQQEDGSFRWTREEKDSSLFMSAYAVTALLGNCFGPPEQTTKAVTVTVRIEGKKETLFDGPVTCAAVEMTDSGGRPVNLPRPTVLSALEVASQEGTFEYLVDRHSLGLFVRAIGGESDDWKYRLNDRLPAQAADRLLLHSGDEVVWFVNGESFFPLKIFLEREALLAGEAIAVRVAVFDESGWAPSKRGAVLVNSEKHLYEEGTVTIPFYKPGSFTIHAESQGCIRSRKKIIKVWPDKSISTYVKIKSNQEDIWEGLLRLGPFTEIKDMDGRSLEIMGHSLVGALAAAAKASGFSYQIKQTAQGLIIVSIGTYEEDNSNGSWWYEINGEQVTQDVDEVIVQEGDRILLYYGRDPQEKS